MDGYDTWKLDTPPEYRDEDDVEVEEPNDVDEEE